MTGATPLSPVELVSLAADGIEIDVVTLGASLAALRIPDRDGRVDDVVLGHTDPVDYLDRSVTPHLGAIAGRVANRIGGANVEIDGRAFGLDANDGPNTLHGGSDGWGHRIWEVVRREAHTAVLRLVSDDGDQGFPGRVVAETTYQVTPGSLTITVSATTDAPTLFAPTSHPYWNLAGVTAGGSIDDHHLEVAATGVLEVDESLIPTGDIGPAPVFDGGAIGAARWDHCLTLAADVTERGGIAATLHHPGSGRVMHLSTGAPGLQLYTGDGLRDPFVPRQGVALEAELWPDAVHHPEWLLPSPVLRPGTIGRWWVRHDFGVLAG